MFVQNVMLIHVIDISVWTDGHYHPYRAVSGVKQHAAEFQGGPRSAGYINKAPQKKTTGHGCVFQMPAEM